jgi:hypothetical protein
MQRLLLRFCRAINTDEDVLWLNVLMYYVLPV